MSTASAASFKDRLKVYSEERVPRGVFGTVQGEVFDLIQELFSHAGAKDSLPKSLTASLGAWDNVKCPSKSKFKSIRQPELAELAEKTCKLLVERCYPALEHLSSAVDENEKRILQCQEDLIAAQKSLAESQSRLVKLQCQLLEKRDAEISAVQSTAVSEMKTFASVLQKSCDTALAPARVSRAIGVVAEDRANNVIMHGLPDVDEQDVDHLTEEVVCALVGVYDNPRIMRVERIGRFKDGVKRPVKVVFWSKDTRDKVLARKANLMKGCSSNVYISPDLTPKEREERRILVGKLKETRSANPGKKFSIKGGKVVEVTS